MVEDIVGDAIECWDRLLSREMREGVHKLEEGEYDEEQDGKAALGRHDSDEDKERREGRKESGQTSVRSIETVKRS